MFPIGCSLLAIPSCLFPITYCLLPIAQAAAREREAAGKDLDVVRAQIERWNSLQKEVDPAEPVPSLVEEVGSTIAIKGPS